MDPPNSQSRGKKYNHFKQKQNTLYSTARPPTNAAPITPQAAVCMGIAAPLEVEVVEEEPLCATPSAVDSFALRLAESPEKAVARTLVLLLQADGTE
jgi:hypothetical protein